MFQLPTFLAIIIAWAILGVFLVMSITVSDLCYNNDTLSGITNMTNIIITEGTKKVSSDGCKE